MANIANYGELKTTIQNYLDFSDNSVTSKIPLFISMAETELLSNLRIPSLERVIFRDVTTDDEYRLPIPVDFLELKRMYYPDTYENISQVDLSLLPTYKYNYSLFSGDLRPINFARDQDYWVFPRFAVNGLRIQITYYADVTPMANNNDTNVLLRDAPLYLLYRSLGECHRFLENLQMADYWMSKAQEEILAVQTHADRAENAGSVITIQNYPW